MRFQGGRAAALTAVVLLAAGACTSKPSKDDARTSEIGAYFLVQEATAKKGNCGRFGSEREFNMASGEVEAVVTRVDGAPCQGAAGRAGDNPSVEWGEGDDNRQVFTGIPNVNGIYDCAGTAK